MRHGSSHARKDDTPARGRGVRSRRGEASYGCEGEAGALAGLPGSAGLPASAGLPGVTIGSAPTAVSASASIVTMSLIAVATVSSTFACATVVELAFTSGEPIGFGDSRPSR